MLDSPYPRVIPGPPRPSRILTPTGFARHGDPLHIGRAQVGEVCSAMRLPPMGWQTALARVHIAHAGVGAAVEVGKLDGQQKHRIMIPGKPGRKADGGNQTSPGGNRARRRACCALNLS